MAASMTCCSSSFLQSQLANSRPTHRADLGIARPCPRKSRLRLHCTGEQQQQQDKASTTSSSDKEDEEELQELQRNAFATLEHFVELNSGSWSGTFTQYDATGNAIACIPTRLKANIYGKGEHISLYQTLSVKPAASPTSVSGDNEDSEWVDYKIDEIDLVTIDRIHKVGYFREDNAYCLSHFNARIPDVVLRAGLLGEDDDETSNSFPGVTLPCRRPALVNESCMFSASGNSRIRAFHVLNAQGFLDMIGVFHEHRENRETAAFNEDSASRRVDNVLGKWEGRAVTQRTGLYGFTTGIEELVLNLRMEDNGQVVQTIRSSPENRKTTELVLHGETCDGVIRFADGLQITLLPQNMFIVSPVSVGTCVQKSHCFCLEFGWIDAPGHRRRLIRTYDTSGAVVSTTLSDETKVEPIPGPS